MSKGHFVLTAVKVLAHYRLRLTYADEQTFEVDLSGVIRKTKVLAALKDGKLIKKAKLGFAGRSVDWIEDELDMGSDNLQHIAVEQADGIGHERIWTWLDETGLTLEQAAEALGISRRMLVYFTGMAKNRFHARSGWRALAGRRFVRKEVPCLCTPPSPREYAALHA